MSYDSLMLTREPPLVVGYLDLAEQLEPTEERSGEDPAAIYVHFPFCSHLCTYCDFDTFAGRDQWIQPYLHALDAQIRHSPRVRGTSLYVGGGTPSLMTSQQTARLVGACLERFRLPEEAEATIEANPSNLSLERLQGFRSAGFNRLSLGVQSADARLLRLLGRRHRGEEAAAAVETARRAGFQNLSVDLIYGVPMQDLAIWRETLSVVVSWGVEHVSCYMLTVEPGTPMERGVVKGTLKLPPEEEIVAMYEAAEESLGAAGYRRYEISNWARPGFESTHNLAYWRNRPYLGIGAGAAGCWQGRRYKIGADLEAFVAGAAEGRLPLIEDETLEARRQRSDTLILGLRLEEGLSISEFVQLHGVNPFGEFGEALEWAEEWGLLSHEGDRLRLTHQGVLLSNELFERLL